MSVEALEAPVPSKPAPPAGSGLITPDRALIGLVAMLLAMAFVAFAGLIVPGSIFEHTAPMLDPIPVIYPHTRGRLLLAATLLVLFLLFLVAVYLALRTPTRGAAWLAIAGTVALSAVFALVYASGAQDMFHNIADMRTLWVYGDNPMLTPPADHPEDPFFQHVLAWPGSVSAYGPLFYAFGVPFSWAAGESLLANVLALKAMNAIGLAGLAWLCGREAERLMPGRGVAAAVGVGWNPFILWECISNAHNDVLMMLFAVLALSLTTRGLLSQGVVALGASALVKYSTALLAPLVIAWGWGKAAERHRLSAIAVMVTAALATTATCLVWPRALREVVLFMTTDRVWQSPAGVLTSALEPSLGADAANEVARYVCWGLTLLFLVIAIRQLDGTNRSLFRGAFITLAALGTLGRPEFFAWYFIWFIPLGAIIGGWEWDLSLLASAAGLWTYAIFPWASPTETANLLYVLFAMVAPLLLLAALLGFRRARSSGAAPGWQLGASSTAESS